MQNYQGFQHVLKIPFSSLLFCVFSVDPNFYSVNLLMLGKSYKKMGDQKQAMLYLGKASEYVCENDEDRKVCELSFYSKQNDIDVR